LFDSPREVVIGLVTYTDWWQPSTTSVIQVAAARRDKEFSDGLRPGLLEHLDRRTELCRRMAHLKDRERLLLYLWYVKQLEAGEIARLIHVSRRHVFRIRGDAIQRIVDFGKDEEAA
jgi:DNA-directed RNA polymerase specialized sigma subunit